MMTRKDYIKTAEILRDFGNDISDFSELVWAFADWFADDNPNFRYSTFVEACGLEE
jgi:hypothetical protein